VNGRRSSARFAACAALLAAVAALACPAPGYDPDWRSRTQRTLVLPLNIVAEMPDELIAGSSDVDDILLDHLAARGKSVQTIGFADATTAWRASEADCRAAEAKGCDRFLRVASYAARRLRADHDFDVLIVPYLLLRGARTNGYVASFDGVERTLRSPGYGPYGPYGYSPYGPYPYGYGFGGPRIRAASLKVYGFSADGKRLFDGIGGLDVVDEIQASDEGPGAYSIVVREDLLRDPNQIREGVARALSKFVPRDGAERAP
jgi:hypothetical protein